MIRKPVLLVVDDEPGMLSVLERFAAPLGFFVITDCGGRNALDRIRETSPDVALVDLHMPEIGGLDVLRAIRLAQPECRVILMTGQAEVDSAIEAVKTGAMDYLSKPLDLNRLRRLLGQVADDLRLRAEVLSAERHTAQQMELCGMIGRSPVMQELFGLVRRVAPHVRTALVMGETGAGKEGIARAIHRLGPRKSRPFVTVNCSAVVEPLFESELFGHARGAFTGATEHKAGLFEVADGGTIFLDEIGELPLAVQAKLLRVLETGEVQRVGSLQPRKVDVRVVAATNRDLRAAAAAGTFRSDLYYRLDVVELQVPPLRDRRHDIPYLTAAFVREFAARFGKNVEGVSATAERVLMESPWPGNVRELRNVLERACMLAEGRWLAAGDVARGAGDGRPSGVALSPRSPEAPVDLSSLARSQIMKVLEEERGNKRAAAARLGVSRRTLYRMLERHRLPLNPFDVAATA